jgi:hypothetical protein
MARRACRDGTFPRLFTGACRVGIRVDLLAKGIRMSVKRNSRIDRKRIKWLESQLAKSRQRKPMGGGFLAWISVISFVVGLLFFWPRMTVEATGPIDPKNPRPIPFKLTNAGFVSLVDVQPVLGVCQIIGGQPRSIAPGATCA